MKMFIYGLVCGWGVLAATIYTALEMVGEPSVLWVYYGENNENLTFFNNMSRCEIAKDKLIGASDSACFRAEVFVPELKVK